jgi:hypothetical protein
MPDQPEIDAHARLQREKFIKAFEVIGDSTHSLSDLTEKQIDVMASLFDAITKDKDGLIAAFDDLIVEIQGLRGDLRVIAKAGGLQAALGALFGTKRRS